jgi:acyl-CoA hydrolase
MKKVSDSAVVMHELVLPNDTNVLGNVLGGRVMHLIDICAAMSAYKHARSPVVTASIDHLNFLSPAKKGDILILKSSVNYVSRTSMEIGVRVESENTITGDLKHTASAHLTFVALDENKKPKQIMKVEPITDVQKNRYKAAEKRVMNRKKELYN